MKLVNLTPHKINIVSKGGSKEVAPSGAVARVDVTYRRKHTVDDVDYYVAEYGEVTGLPAPEMDTFYIVSMLVFESSDRPDLVCPGELVRDAEGRPVGCKGLRVK